MILKTETIDPRANVTMRGAFEQYYWSPEMKPRTLEVYENMLRHWEDLTEDPTFAEMDSVTLHGFKTAYLEYNSAASFNKERRHFMAIINRMSPAVRKNPDGLGIVDRFIYIKPIPETRKIPRVASDEQVNAIYDACDIATWPRFEFGPTAWWRALVVFLYNTGVRRNDFLNLETTDVNLQEALIQFDAEKTGKDQMLPLHQSVVEHFEQIWSDRKYVFPKSKGYKLLYRQWYEIQSFAGIPADDHFTFHQLRSTCGTNLFKRSPGAAQEMLGHSSIETTRKAYAFLTDHLVEVAQTQEQPSAFESRPDLDPDPNILRFPA